MQVDILTISGEKSGRSIDLPEDVFGIDPNDHVVYLAVKQYLAHQRQGTHKAKERGEIAGSTKKIKRQKGTGTARAGSLKNPLFRGGGRVFGPRPRNYSIKLNKKVRALARNSVLSQKVNDGSIIVIEDFTFESAKTKEYVNILKNLNLDGKKSVVVTSEMDKTLYLSSRNVPKSSVTYASDLNTYRILNAGTLILQEGAIGKIVNNS